ncbi:F0F1 ATP synthase subunit B [Balneolaceae bacterium YR4-1]|uniref:ATP synthase subunit b n=1 Tax=Halalkalibaculum roseum TaxID=2709311 RepID=A0A6M1SWN2_9BACT|nr:F0F1 ATP synthase subunit B [Halalkalibaculum roseum]NGP76568.1 F0F1 ATP synthase subunit B [Halalkalibaculum roseum]
MNIDWFTLTAQIVNFLILLFLLRKFLYGPLRDVMEKREQKVTSRLEEAQQKLGEAETKRETYQQKLDELEHKKEQMISEAKAEADEKRKELEHEARKQVETMQKNWEESIELEKESFFNELHQQATYNAIDLLRKLVNSLASRSLEEVTIQKFIELLKRMDKKERKRALQSALDFGEGKMKVVSSFELPEETKNEIKNVLKEVFSAELNCEFEISSRLGFGIEMRAEGWKIGWNANIYLEDLTENLEHLFQTGKKEKEHQTIKQGL